MNSKPLQVLIIEDNLADVRLIEALLEDYDPNAIVLEHVEFLPNAERLGSGDIDVILLDLNLRASGGLETLRELRQANSALPVVVLTGLGDEETAREAVRAGAQDYLVKGEVDANLLVRSIIYAFERCRVEQHLRESESRLRLLTGQIPAILWTTDGELKLTSAVGGGLRDLDLEQEEILGSTVEEFFQTSGSEKDPLSMHQRALDGTASSDVVHWRERFSHFYVEALRNANDDIVGTIGVALDITMQRRMEQGLRAAQRIQQHLLPEAAPSIPGFEIAARCFPAEHCSGDYFDFIPLPDGSLAVVVADASGHGFGPAILATTVRSYLRAAAMQDRDIHEMLTTVNWLLANDSEADQYVTLFCCRIDPKTNTLCYSAAGHQALLIDAHHRARILESNCLPLGIDSSETFSLSRNIALRRGDILIFVTDGILETHNDQDELFGMKRLIDRVKQLRDQPAQAIVETLYQDARAFAQGGILDDDITVIVAKFVGVGPDAGPGLQEAVTELV